MIRSSLPIQARFTTVNLFFPVTINLTLGIPNKQNNALISPYEFYESLNNQKKGLRMEHYGNLVDVDPAGTHCILFQNKCGLQLNGIRNIFSEFGEIVNIRISGDSKGFHFIRYWHPEEVIRAIEGLKNHPAIQLLEHRKKDKNQRKDAKSVVDENKKINYNKNKDENKNKSWNKHQKQYIENEEFEENSPQCEKVSSNSSNSITNGNTSLCEVSGLHTNHVKDHLKKDSLKNTDLKSMDYPDDSELPDLVTSKGETMTVDVSRKSLTAEEVIVGNIHPDFGSPYILHLLERYDPIAVSRIYCIPNTGVRYCHVYFRTADHSLHVEKDMDHFNLSGKKLFVLRTCRLKEEGS